MPHSSPTSPRKSSRWRLVGRAAIALAIVIVLLLVTVQILFLTNVPRNLVLAAIEKQAGLRISAQSLSTGFFGQTTLEDVTIGLPLADKPFLSVPEMTLKHSWLISLVFGRSFEIEQIALNEPKLQISQDAFGTWNVQQAIVLLSQNSKPSENNQIPGLPGLDIKDATLTVTDGQNRSATIEHLDFTGQPDGLLVWEIRAEAEGHLKVDGKIAPGDRWAHAVNFELDNLDSWLSPWVPSWPASAKIAARWTGQVVSGELKGQLNIARAEYNDLALSGPIDIESVSDGVTFRPQGMMFRDDGNRQLDTQVISGSVTINSGGVETQNLGLQFARGRANLDAGYSFAQRSATLHAAWNDLAIPATVVQSGQLRLAYNSDHGAPNFNGTLVSQGTSPTANWDAAISVDGSGNSRDSMAATVTANRLVVDSAHGRSLDLSGLATDFASNADGITLREVRLGSANPLTGHGGVNYAKRVAWFTLDGRGWPVPGEAGRTVDIDLNMWASPKHVHLEELYLSSGLCNVYLNGDYQAQLPKPVKAMLYVSENPPMGPTQETPAPFGGNFQGQFDLNGTLNPIDIAFDGSANGQGLYYRQRSFGNLDLQITGSLQNNQISVHSQDVQLFGGAWTIDGQWPMQNSLFRIDNLSVQHLSLPLASGNSNVAGTLDGKWAIDVRDFTPDGISIDGSASIHDLNVTNDPNLCFDEIEMPDMHVGNGWAKISQIALTRNVGKSSGKASVNLVTMLEEPSVVWLKVNAKGWPAQTRDGRGVALISAAGKLRLDLADRSALGSLNVAADALWDAHSLGNVRLGLEADQRQYQAQNIQIKTLDGTATGGGRFDLDAPYQTSAQLAWKDLNLSELHTPWPAMAPLTGKISGSLKVHPADTPRPLGPLAIDLAIDSDHVAVGGKGVGNLTAAAFVAPGRIVLDDSPQEPSAVQFAGGMIHFWGRVTRHEGDIYQSLLQLNLQNLDLDTLLPPGSKVQRTPGLLSGQITAIGTPGAAGLSYGQGTLTLEQSDLAGTGPIAFVYNLMHLFHNPNKPAGSGTINFTIQDENATITGMQYFDRGTELAINGDIDDLLNFPHSPVDLIVVGSGRPLKSINIPGISDFDAAINAIQHNAIAVRVTGHFDKPVQKSILFNQIGSEMLNYLFGQTSAGNGSQ